MEKGSSLGAQRARPVAIVGQTSAITRARLRPNKRERCVELEKTEAVQLYMRGVGSSADGVQYLLAKHVMAAYAVCPSMKQKRVTPHAHIALQEAARTKVMPSNDGGARRFQPDDYLVAFLDAL